RLSHIERPASMAAEATAATRATLFMRSAGRDPFFELALRSQALEIAAQRGDREDATLTQIADARIALRETPVDLNLVRPRAWTDVVNRDVVVFAPEERAHTDSLPLAEDVPRRHLPLALGDDPVLDPNALPRDRIGPARRVARREDVRIAGPEVLVDG